MQDYIIQEYNRRTKKYRNLGAMTAKSKEEAMNTYIRVSGWKPSKEILLHVEAPNESEVRNSG